MPSGKIHGRYGVADAGAVGRGAGEASRPSLGITYQGLMKTVLKSGVAKVTLAA
jgi:hypothetical protein